MVKHFQEVLQMLRGRNIQLLKSESNWDFWSAEYKTPSKSIIGHYLYLKSKCPLKEASESNLTIWRRLSQNSDYDVIVTPKSPLAKSIEQTKKHFKGKNIWTSRKLIEENLLSELDLRNIDTEPYFIDPDIEANGEHIKSAITYLSNWFINPSVVSIPPNSFGILRANAGVGKTTLARILSDTIHKKNSKTIPILVEAETWRPHLHTDILLENIWNMAIAERFIDTSQLNQTAFKVLIREGIFPIIFDGFDELCLNPYSTYTPAGFIQDLLETLESDETAENAKIFLTTRETFWQSYCEEIDTSDIDLFLLKSFSNEKRKKYFKKRLENPAERDSALRIAGQISGRLYDGLNIETTNIDRPSGVPFILDMIASYVKDNPEPNINPYGTDPLAPLIEAVCRRENIRQTLNIPYDKQIELFEELFRDHNEIISTDDVRLYLEVYCNITDEGVINRFLSHFFLSRKETKTFVPRYEVLKVYFVARFLVNGLIDESRNVDRKKMGDLLAMSSSGGTQMIDWVVGQLLVLEKPILIQAIHHALRIINDPVNISSKKEAGMAIFNVITRLLIEKGDKKIRLNQLSEYLNANFIDNYLIFKNNIFTGSIKAVDFSSCKFINCIIANVDFNNCIFDSSTIFDGCEFDGQLKFTNCKGEKDFKEVKSECSKEAQYCLDQLFSKTSADEVKQSFSEDALYKALKKFKGQFGYSSIRFDHRLKGLQQSNPATNHVWEALLKNGVVDKHKLSKFSDIGLHLTENHDIRKEVITFLDNGYLGVNLKKVIKYIIDKI